MSQLHAELAAAHEALWDAAATHVRFRGRRYRIARIDRPGKLFAQVSLPGRKLVTQNLRKPSRNTERCEEGARITWVFKKGRYSGEIVTEAGAGDSQLIALRPRRVVDRVPLTTHRI